MDNTTKNWLLAFFFVVVPILLVLLFCHLTKDNWVHSLLPLVDHCRCWNGSPASASQEPVHIEHPQSVPYSSRRLSFQTNVQPYKYPVPSHTVDPQHNSEPDYYASPLPSLQPMEQQCIPQRPPPPVLKKAPQEHLYPSRPAPLPPK